MPLISFASLRLARFKGFGVRQRPGERRSGSIYFKLLQALTGPRSPFLPALLALIFLDWIWLDLGLWLNFRLLIESSSALTVIYQLINLD